jgi:hypothetical protein
MPSRLEAPNSDATRGHHLRHRDVGVEAMGVQGREGVLREPDLRPSIMPEGGGCPSPRATTVSRRYSGMSFLMSRQQGVSSSAQPSSYQKRIQSVQGLLSPENIL